MKLSFCHCFPYHVIIYSPVCFPETLSDEARNLTRNTWVVFSCRNCVTTVFKIATSYRAGVSVLPTHNTHPLIKHNNCVVLFSSEKSRCELWGGNPSLSRSRERQTQYRTVRPKHRDKHNRGVLLALLACGICMESVLAHHSFSSAQSKL